MWKHVMKNDTSSMKIDKNSESENDDVEMTSRRETRVKYVDMTWYNMDDTNK